MTDSTTPPGPGGLLTPVSRAVAGLALALAGLLGPNALPAGIQMGARGGPEAGHPALFALALAVATAVPALLALWLTWGDARGTGTSWPSHLSRAAVVVALLALIGAALMLVGGILQF